MISDSVQLDVMNNESTNNNVKLLSIQHTPEVNSPSLASLDELPPTPPPIATSNTGSKTSLPQPTSSANESSSEDEEEVEAGRSSSAKSNKSKKERYKNNVAVRVLSDLYSQLLVVAAGILVLTEVLNNTIPLLHYNGYLFSYLVGGAIVCLLTTYICMAFEKCPTLNDDSESGDLKKQTAFLIKDIGIYLRIGILVLGLATLTWIGFEIGTYFTMEDLCLDELNLAQPILLALFTFLQVHFLFMNTPRILKALGWFRNIALMHLQAANLAVWIRLFLWETAKEWLDKSHVLHNATNPWTPEDFNASIHVLHSNKQHKVYFSTRCFWDPQNDEKIEQVLYYRYCLQSSTIGLIWERAMPYIFPFVLQFSLVCSTVMYYLWQSGTSVVHCNINSTPKEVSAESDVTTKPKCANRKIDCRGSSKGLFLGLLVTVVGLIVIILFFVLTNNHKLHLDTLFVVSSVHCGVMGLSTLAVLFGLCQIRNMCPCSRPQPALHSALKSWGRIAVFLFGACGMIVGSNYLYNTKYLVVFVDGVIMVVHCCIQSLFIHLLSKKCCTSGCSHDKSKPGRQTVTFLIFSNMVLWLIESITAQNPVAGQLHLNFYGAIPWGVMTRGVLPIVMCYRFVCSVTFMDIWRNSYISNK